MAASTACSNCPAGYYASSSSSASCTACPANTYNPNTSSSSSSACVACATSFSSSTGSAQCYQVVQCSQVTPHFFDVPLPRHHFQSTSSVLLISSISALDPQIITGVADSSDFERNFVAGLVATLPSGSQASIVTVSTLSRRHLRVLASANQIFVVYSILSSVLDTVKLALQSSSFLSSLESYLQGLYPGVTVSSVVFVTSSPVYNSKHWLLCRHYYYDHCRRRRWRWWILDIGSCCLLLLATKGVSYCRGRYHRRQALHYDGQKQRHGWFKKGKPSWCCRRHTMGRVYCRHSKPIAGQRIVWCRVSGCVESAASPVLPDCDLGDEPQRCQGEGSGLRNPA